MARDQFTFYRSYYEALKNLPQKDQTKVLMAICAYALDDDPPTLSGVPLSVFTLIRPTLDTGRKKAMNRKNKTKSNIEQTDNKKGTNKEQNRKEKEREREVEGEREGEVEGDYPSTNTLLTSGVGPSPLAVVFRAYMDRVNPSPSPTSMEELGSYAKAMGSEVCLRAIDRAIDAGKANWNYIRGILRNLEAQGVRCLADLEALDKQHERAKGIASGSYSGAGNEPPAVMEPDQWIPPGGDGDG